MTNIKLFLGDSGMIMVATYMYHWISKVKLVFMLFAIVVHFEDSSQNLYVTAWEKHLTSHFYLLMWGCIHINF